MYDQVSRTIGATRQYGPTRESAAGASDGRGKGLYKLRKRVEVPRAPF